MFSISTVTVVLSVLLVTCNAFHVSRSAVCRSTKLFSKVQPTSVQENWRQSMNGLIKFGVAGSAFFGLTTAALAAEAVKGKAPVISSITPPSAGPVIDAEGFTVSDTGLKYRDTKVQRTSTLLPCKDSYYSPPISSYDRLYSHIILFDFYHLDRRGRWSDCW